MALRQRRSFLSLPASRGSRPFLACGYIAPVSASVFTWSLLLTLGLPSVFLKRTLVTRAYIGNLKHSHLDFPEYI